MIPGVVAAHKYGGDPYWAYKVLGLHCNGTNGSTTFTDVKGHAVTAGGNAQISTAQYAALTGNTASAYFDGTGDFLSIPDSADWNMGTGDFSIRFWSRPDSSGSDRDVISYRISSDANNFWFIRHTTAGKIRVYGKTSGTVITDVLSSATLSNSTQQFIEVVRTGGSVKISIDGTFGTTITTDGTGAWPDVSGSLYIGCPHESPGAGSYYTGYLDEIEIYKGVAINTVDFTPPTTEFIDY